jgi:hypothetical protein
MQLKAFLHLAIVYIGDAQFGRCTRAYRLGEVVELYICHAHVGAEYVTNECIESMGVVTGQFGNGVQTCRLHDECRFKFGVDCACEQKGKYRYAPES